MSALPPLGGTQTTRTRTPSTRLKRPGGAGQGRQRGFNNSVGNSRELYEALQRSHQVEAELREQLQKLTAEVRTLRNRLDGLRKAKTQTLIKKEMADGDDSLRREESCTCRCEVEALQRKLAAKDEEWKTKEEEWQGTRQEEIAAAKREVMRSRPKTATKELLAASQTEVVRLRELVAHLQAEARCRKQPQRPAFGFNAEIGRRLEELAETVQIKEKEFCRREQEIRASLEQQCKSSHQLWMNDTRQAVKRLEDENARLRQFVEDLRKRLEASS